MFGGIVLAAGASTRFGSPKALLPIQGEAAVARAARLLKENGCDRVVVVVGADREKIRKAVPRLAQFALNEHWQAGRTGSIKTGFKALPPSCDVVVWPVDHPAAAGGTVRALVAREDGAIRVPVHQGRRGHPILLEASVRAEVLALTDDQPFHDVVHHDPSRVVEVPVDDAGVLLNVDVPEDAERVEAHFGGRPHARPVA